MRRWQGIALLLAVLHGLELWRHGHPLASVLMLSATALAVLLRRRLGQAAAARPQRLLLAADGRLYLRLQGGVLAQARLDAGSLRLGRSLLLVLRCDKRRHRLLLGPDNLAPAELAALQRRLPRAAGG